jgi:hypothetical protein
VGPALSDDPALASSNCLVTENPMPIVFLTSPP